METRVFWKDKVKRERVDEEYYKVDSNEGKKYLSSEPWMLHVHQQRGRRRAERDVELCYNSQRSQNETGIHPQTLDSFESDYLRKDWISRKSSPWNYKTAFDLLFHLTMLPLSFNHFNSIPLLGLPSRLPLSRNMRLSMVVAYSRLTRAIGYQDALPWPRLKKDIFRFKQLTSNHTVVMGRKTFESCEVNSIPLANRRNVVLSRNPGWAPPAGVVHAQDWHEALILADAGYGGAGYDDGERVLRASDEPRDVFVVGGEAVYRMALSYSCRWIFATEIDGAWPGDVFFPDLGPEWTRIREECCPCRWASDAPVHESGMTYSFVTYRRGR